MGNESETTGTINGSVVISNRSNDVIQWNRKERSKSTSRADVNPGDGTPINVFVVSVPIQARVSDVMFVDSNKTTHLPTSNSCLEWYYYWLFPCDEDPITCTLTQSRRNATLSSRFDI